MQCTQAKEAIQRELDGELTPLRGWRLRRHLAGCDACRTAARQHRAMHAAMARLSAALPAELSGGHPARLRLAEHAAADDVTPTHRTASRRWPALAAAAVLILCITGWRLTVHYRAVSIAVVDPTTTAPKPQSPHADPAPPPPVRVEFDPRSEVIAIPKPSQNPNITILWVYPAVRTAEAAPPPSVEPETNHPEGAHS